MTLRGALALQLRADEKAHVRSTLRFSLHVNLKRQGASRCFATPTWKILFNLGWALAFWAIRLFVVAPLVIGCEICRVGRGFVAR